MNRWMIALTLSSLASPLAAQSTVGGPIKPACAPESTHGPAGQWSKQAKVLNSNPTTAPGCPPPPVTNPSTAPSPSPSPSTTPGHDGAVPSEKNVPQTTPVAAGPNTNP